MKELSVFHIIGPRMIGPSSSHTAGALKIAFIAGKLAPFPIQEVTFRLYGSFAKTYLGHGTDKALIAGILGFTASDPRVRDSYHYGKQAGIQFRFEPDELDRKAHPNTIEIIIKSQKGQILSLTGVSTGGGNCRIDCIDGIKVELTGELPAIVICQHDTYGVIASITNCLTAHEINIAYMRLYRESKGKIAYTIIETDAFIPSSISDELRRNPEILEVKMIICGEEK